MTEDAKTAEQARTPDGEISGDVTDYDLSASMRVLLTCKSYSSPTARRILAQLDPGQKMAVMDALIDYLSKITQWRRKPTGFAAAWILSDMGEQYQQKFTMLIETVPQKPPWLSYIAKTK